MPSRSKIRRIWRTSFYIEGCGTLQTVALRWPIFKQKKGSTNISLGRNYCSMGSSHLPSHDTGPLKCFFIQTRLLWEFVGSATWYSPHICSTYTYSTHKYSSIQFYNYSIIVLIHQGLESFMNNCRKRWTCIVDYLESWTLVPVVLNITWKNIILASTFCQITV
jgi:hypothetical protein